MVAERTTKTVRSCLLSLLDSSSDSRRRRRLRSTVGVDSSSLWGARLADEAGRGGGDGEADDHASSMSFAIIRRLCG